MIVDCPVLQNSLRINVGRPYLQIPNYCYSTVNKFYLISYSQKKYIDTKSIPSKDSNDYTSKVRK